MWYRVGGQSSEVEDARRLCRLILGHVECAPSSASKFAGSVRETTESIQHWIKEHHDVTSGQVVALYNMWRKVKHWIPKVENGPHQNAAV